MTKREEMAEAAFEAWWAAMPQELANEVAACGEQIRSGLKEAVKLGYVAALTRIGERLAAMSTNWRARCMAEKDCADELDIAAERFE